MSTAPTRQSAKERREAVLEAARHEFSRKGLHGASTDAIAKRAGISQPYLFRLFGTKKELYLATAKRSIEELQARFEAAAAGKTGREALEAMGGSYTELMQDRDRLLLMLQCWSSCDDAEICAQVRSAWRNLVDLAERVSGEPPEVVTRFFAHGTLLTILMSMQAFEQPEPWSERLIAACLES